MAIKTVPIHPPALRWAREEIGLTLEKAVAKTKFDIAQLQKWEDGEEKISLPQAKKLAEKYKVSLPFLYLKNIPKDHQFEKLIDFRRDNEKHFYSDRLCLAIKTARSRQEWMSNILQTEGKQPLNWLGAFDVETDAETIAIECKNWLNVNSAEIAQLKDGKEALAYWISKVENKGVLVAVNHTHSAYRVDRKEYSGLVLHDDYAPLILLNPQDNPSRRIFTLIHELSHLLLKQDSSISLINFRMNYSEYDVIEVLCNKIASTILVDKEFIKNNWSVEKAPIDSINFFTHQFNISHSAIAVAVKTLGLISQNSLDEILNFYDEQYRKNLSKPQGGRTVPDKQTLDRCGRLLTTQVLNAYEQGSINASEVYDVLGMKLKYLGALSKRLGFPLHRWVS
ncbi:MAG: XRE family transcriptional regulator [Proteobacteria bacterium]|nr:XRE family transcriptional regulator [Pseudomonadota bacterium]